MKIGYLLKALWGWHRRPSIEARRAGGTARPPWGKICPEEMHGIRKEKEVEAIVRSGITIEKTTESVT